MSELAWLFIAFLAVWAGLGFYLFTLSSRQKRLEDRLKELDPTS